MARVEGMTRAGNLVANELGPVYPPGAPPPPPSPEPVGEPTPEPVVATGPPAEPKPVAAGPAAEKAGGQDWLLPATVFGGFNLLLVGGGLAWWLLARRRRDADDLVLVDAETAPDAGKPAPVGDAATDITREYAA
jgi:hypothetical protein